MRLVRRRLCLRRQSRELHSQWLWWPWGHLLADTANDRNGRGIAGESGLLDQVLYVSTALHLTEKQLRTSAVRGAVKLALRPVAGCGHLANLKACSYGKSFIAIGVTVFKRLTLR